MKLLIVSLLAATLLLISACRFTLIDQPETILPGELFQVDIVIDIDIVPEPNIHKGVICVLMPTDWELTSASYSSIHGSGIMTASAAWADSAEQCYPAADFAEGVQWVAVLSDTGFAYDDPFAIDVSLEIQASDTEGCFNLGYLTTKATPNLICSGNQNWAPLSYPNPISISSDGEVCDTFVVERAEEWEVLFDRTSGWTGADGIYSIPLNGDEQPGAETETLILFSDTFIGEVDENDNRSGASLVNNTYAIMSDSEPLEENIQFFWAEDAYGQPEAVFKPDTPNSNPGDWYWLMDGIALGDSIYVFALRLEPGGALGFEIAGTALLSFVLSDEYEILEYDQIDAPYYSNEGEGWEIVPGQAVMSMLDESGNPDADGYIYVYGPKSYGALKELVAARVLPEHLTNFDEWRYWNGSEWSTDIAQSASLTSSLSQEFSVSQANEGNFLVVSQTGATVSLRIGDSPVGPFGFLQTVWYCPEVDEDPDIFVYNAKAHPHLSNPGELLLSYNVNTWDFWDHFSNADIYRPRLISLTLTSDLTGTPHFDFPQLPARTMLLQNYPNPFNPSTVISYQLANPASVFLKIYTITGELVATLIDGERQSASQHKVAWDGTDVSGEPAASGIYIYQLRANQMTEAGKMILTK